MNKLNVNLSYVNYPIFIERDLFNNIGKAIKEIYNNKKIFVITDWNVEKLYGKALVENLQKENFEVKLLAVEPGEISKSLGTVEGVYEELLNFKISRSDLIIAFGGGVVGDMAGFVASTLLRGIPFVQIPTTLLSQVDSSVGGKVGINLPKGKNLVGSFYQPLAVFIDPNLLKTLNNKYFADGMGEVIKYSLIKDKNLFNNLIKYKDKEEVFENLEYIIYTCVKIKKDIVQRDEKDTGERMILNFGHTIGHAIEKYFNFKKYSHGEAVGIGMYLITKASIKKGITEEGTDDLIKNILEKYNLPWTVPNMNTETIVDSISLDKKNFDDRINLILLKNIGDGFIYKIQRNEIHSFL